jgi:hypothetical protein
VRLKADSVRVVLSKEFNLLEFYNLKRSAAWNFFDLKELKWCLIGLILLMFPTNDDNYIES